MFRLISGARARSATAVLLTVLAALVLASSAITGTLAAGTAPSAGGSQTRSASCHAFEFRPVDSLTGADYANTKRIRSGSDGSGFFSCDPGLPTRAVVKKVQISIWDGSGSSQVKFCGLYRSGLGGATAAETVQELASVPPTGIAQAPGFARLTDTSILHATVDNANFAYWLQCNLEQAGQSLGLYGANVVYSISLANG